MVRRCAREVGRFFLYADHGALDVSDGPLNMWRRHINHLLQFKFRGQQISVDRSPSANDYQPFDQVLHLTYVSGPTVGDKELSCRLGQVAGALDEMLPVADFKEVVQKQ